MLRRVPEDIKSEKSVSLRTWKMKKACPSGHTRDDEE